MHTGKWIGDATPVVDAPKEGRWIARPQKPRWIVQAGVFMVIGPFPSLLRPIISHWLGESRSWVVVLSIYVGIFALLGIVVLRERRARRMRAADHALMDASFGDQFPVEMTIVAGGKRLGTDRGVVWFDEGLMGFSGASSSFVLAAWDVEMRRDAQTASFENAAVPEGALVLKDAPIASYIIAHPIGKRLQAFWSRFVEFEKETAAEDAERFWPPLEPYSEGATFGKERLQG